MPIDKIHLIEYFEYFVFLNLSNNKEKTTL